MKDDHLTLRVPSELSQVLARWARDHGIPKSQAVREALVRYLTLSSGVVEPARRLTARELAVRWPSLPRLGREEAADLAADVAAGRAALPPARPPWE